MEKVLSFIYNLKKEKFLLLRNNSHDKKHGGDYWFVVTGAVEKGEGLDDAVKREIKEETNLDIVGTFYLNWSSLYIWDKERCNEHNFLSFVESENIILNEESIEYQWLNLEDFVSKINWGLNKEELKIVLENGINRLRYFKEEKIDDFTKRN